MRIAIVGSRGYPSYYGGFETFVRRLAPALRDQGHEVTVYGRGGGWRFRSRVTDGIHCVDTPGLETKSLSTLSHGMFASMHACHQDYDAALVVNVAHGFFLEQFQAAGIPTVVNVDGIEWLRGKWGTLARATFLAARSSQRRAARRWSPTLARSLRSGTSSSAFALSTWPTVQMSCPTTARTECGSSAWSRVPTFSWSPGWLRRTTWSSSWTQSEDLPTQPPVVVVGSANYRCATTRRLEEMSARGQLQWLGHVSDQALLGQLWSNCRLYVHGHSAGGTNPALLQALGFGAPTLALDTVFNREILAAFPRALYPADTDSLREMMERELHEPQSHATAVEEGQSLVQTSYAWDDICAQYEHLLLEAAETVAVPLRMRPVPAIQGG